MELVNKKLTEDIAAKLKRNGQTIAVAESVTAGMLQLAIGSATDAACYFQGGLTAYNLGQKFKHLGVEPIHASSVNCVSQQVASQMATNVSEQYASDWGVAVTGYATPVPDSDNKTFAYYAISLNGKIRRKGKIVAGKLEPYEVQRKYVEEILKQLRKLI